MESFNMVRTILAAAISVHPPSGVKPGNDDQAAVVAGSGMACTTE
jgi:hypothetical protein